MHILVVEDELEMARVLEQALRESGYDVTVAHNGQDGVRAFDGHDLVLADVMMPVMNGFDMVKQIRASGSRVPVIFLTAKDATPAEIEGLDAGGDDYITKPFKLASLLARIRALLRRSAYSCESMRLADLLLDCRQRHVTRSGRTVDLSETEYRLLETFMRHQDDPISKVQLLREVWHEEPGRDENLVEVYVRYLRIKLETGNRSRLIHTVRGIGYVFSENAPKP